MYKELKKEIKVNIQKNEIAKKKRTNILEKKYYILFEKLGFSVKYDKEKNLYLMDNIHNTRMYTNMIKMFSINPMNSIIYRRAENEYYVIEFIVKNNQIISFKKYDKELGKENPYVLTHVYKKEDK